MTHSSLSLLRAGPWVVWIAGAMLLWVPGAALARFFHREPDAFVQLAMELAIGIAFWPLLFLWTFGWTTLGVRIVFALLVIAAIHRLPKTSPRFALTFLGLFAAVIVSRALQARGLVFPAWVDSVHHAMVVRLLLANGRVPATLDPFIPRAPFFYHWGYHALVAFVSWLTGLTDPSQLPRVMIAFGQLLNALTFVMTYAAGRVLFRSRNAGLAAATIATLVSVMPAFYVSWGRYTQLTGLLLLPPLLIAIWRARDVALIALLAAGLFLVHVRVAIFAAILALIIFAVRREMKPLLAALIATVLTSPWLLRLIATARVPANRIVSESSLMISLFLPVSLAAGWLLVRLVPPRAVAAVLAVVAIYGVISMRRIVNPATVLADADDVVAMEWIRDHTPRDARFLINSMEWIDGSYIGSDGGYWIPIAADRATLVPPALYAWTLPPAEVARINRAIELWNGFVLPDFPATFIYTNRGRDGGRWQTIARIPSARLVYARGNVEIFAIATARAR
ncbi:MAG TPA: hypothetical protein VL284_01480 [Thermoanaerobaculia bacterium]|nr:hypothetical protein [Thermoanaerobaculia bacterium]